MRWPLFLLVAACSSPHRAAAPDAPAAGDASTIDSSYEWFARQATGVAVGSNDIAWSEQPAPCSLEAGLDCHGPGPMITLSGAAGISQLAISAYGASAIAGDETGWFYADSYTGALMRVTATTAPTTFAMGMAQTPAVDATSIYWFDAGGEGGTRGIFRAARGGDGSDATIIAHPAAFQDSLYVFAGDVWWWSCTTGCDVYRASSATPVRTGERIVGADATSLYLVQDGTTWNLVAMAANGTTTTLLANQPQQTAPTHLVADAGELFWSSGSGLFRARPGQMPALVVAAAEVFAITPTQILHDFTPQGYASIAR
ncbi:MAG: hypothetical protein JO257_12160 [Deltaproteobacteria bacterium]|nr:hypothetical protein [Deltaproteobacteria bacterium]